MSWVEKNRKINDYSGLESIRSREALRKLFLSFAIAGKVKLISKYFPLSVVRVIKKFLAIHAHFAMDAAPRTKSKYIHWSV